MKRVSLPAPRPVLWPLRTLQSAAVTDEVAAKGRRVIVIRHAELEGVTPEMLAWWYGHVSGQMEYAGTIWPRYLVWHPLDHISYDVLRGGPNGTVRAGSRIRIREAFGRDPRNLLDIVVDVERVDADAAVIAKHVAGRGVMRLVNEFRAVPRGTMYVTRMIVGAASLAGSLGLNAVIRRRILPGSKAWAWARHHVEEIGNLVHFLPRLWALETGLAIARAAGRGRAGADRR